MATELPKVKFEHSNSEYYYDERLREVRNVQNPNESYRLTNDENDSIEYFVTHGKKDLPFGINDLRTVELREIG